jgi:hypothetical protein
MATDSYRIEQTQQSSGIQYLLGISLSLSFGVTMLFFTALYVKDLQTLAQLPELVWYFICGRPSDDGVVLPMLVLLTTAAFMIAGGLWGVRRLRRGRA